MENQINESMSTVGKDVAAAVIVENCGENRRSQRSSINADNPDQRRATFVANLWNELPNADKLNFNHGRSLQLLAGVYITLIGGSQYAFGIFSNKIKGAAGFTQSDLTTITTVGGILIAFNFPAGVLYDYAGPKSVIFASTFLSCLGFILLALLFQGIIEPTVVTVSVANGISNWGTGFIDCGALITNLFNFPISRGEIMIVQKTMYGLGSTFLALSFDAFFSPTENYIGYAVYVTVIIFLAGVFGFLVLRLPTYKRTGKEMKHIANLSARDKERSAELEAHSFEMYQNPRLLDTRRLNYACTCLLVSLAFFSTLSIMKTFYTFEQSTLQGITIAAICCLFTFVAIGFPINFDKFFDYSFLPDIHAPETFVGAKGEAGDKVPLLREEIGGDANVRASDGRASAYQASQLVDVEGGSKIQIPAAADPNIIPSLRTGFFHNVKRPFIWSIWVSSFAMSGTTMVIVNNIPQIYTSVNHGAEDSVGTTLNIALYGVGSSIGRIIVGFGEIYLHRLNALKRAKQLDYIYRKDHGLLLDDEEVVDLTPVYHNFFSTIIVFMPCAPVIMAIMCFLISVVPANVLAVPVGVSGIAIGVYLAILVLATREIFHVDVAQHYNFFASSGIAASLLLNRVLFGMTYDQETKLNPATSSGSETCNGSVCIRTSFLVLTGLNAAAIATSSFVVYYWWKLRKTF